MSQPKLTLRPPPNVDFVQGYPGIPPGPPDRPEAAVKGAVEVRVPPQGVKAKWVRIELRKVEMLPGGGLQNTFFDFVGQSPLNLWQSGEEYGNLTTQDFPFSIRIPESIPPSITLEKGAGIKYELIATVCLKEKKGFLRRDKSKVLNTSSVIVIDKHELHSTWPVYTHPDSRSVSDDGVTLTVERTHTCYGPGDRIAVDATVKSESLNTVVLRGFHFALKETIVYRAGPNVTGRKGAPQVKVGHIVEQNVPVNAALYGGQMHKAVLAVTLPSSHTSTTLNSARHIDITYVLVVKALMGAGKPLSMDLPVVVSNWPRSVSVEAVSRIGLASNVASHLAHTAPRAQVGLIDKGLAPVTDSKRAQMAEAQRLATGNHPYLHPAPAPPPTTITDSSSEPVTETSRPAGNFNTVPAPLTGFGQSIDEFGFNVKAGDQGGLGGLQIQTIGATPASNGIQMQSLTGDTTPRPRSTAGRQGGQQRTFSVMNYADDIPEEVAEQARAQAQAAAARQQTRISSYANRAAISGTTARSGWATAEEEKRRLYDDAVKKVAEVQGITPPQSPPILSPVPVRDNILSIDALTSSKPQSSWPTAEEEKARLFNEARDRVAHTQGLDRLDGAASPSHNVASGSSSFYSGAVASVARNASNTSNAVTANHVPALTPSRQFLSAEEEKAALARRFMEARAAVDRNQAVVFGPDVDGPSQLLASSPVSYETLYPPAQGSSRDANPPPPNEPPPAFDFASSSQEPLLSEKERMRRAFEERDRALLAQQQMSSGGSSGAPSYQEATSSSPQAPTPSSYGSSSGVSEKERLRRYFEEQDATRMNGNPPMPPPRTTPSGRSLPSPRAQPVPPGGSGPSSRLLSAAEEKARLAAMYAADERGAAPPSSPPLFPAPQPYFNGVNGSSMNGHTVRSGSIGSLSQSLNGHGQDPLSRRSSARAVDYGSIPPLPPLMPRPPKEYIQETQEEDQTLAAKIDAMDNDSGVSLLQKLDPPLELRPFTPFTTSFDAHRHNAIPPPPPLPPKVPVGDS